MYWFDVAAGLALLLGSVWSFFRGLVREVLSIVGLTAALVLSYQNYPDVAQHLEAVIAHPWLRQAAGFALIFLPIVVLYVGIAILLHRLIKVAGLVLPNRLLGGLFGLLKVTVIIAACCFVSKQLFPPFAAQLAGESLLAPMFFQVADALSVLLPPSAAAQLHGLSERLQPRLRGRAPVAPPPPAGQSTGPAAAPAARQENISESDAKAVEKLLRQRLDTQ